MNIFIFFTLIIAIISVFFVYPLHAYSTKHVHSLCGKRAVKHIRKLCPDMCLTGEEMNIVDYCYMGYSDSQIKHICCPE